MAIQTTSNISNAVRTKYTAKYLEAAMLQRLYDQLAMPIGAAQYDLESGSWLGTSYTFGFLSDMNPATAAISQTADITPQILRDATSTITPTSRADAIQWAEAVTINAYTNYGASAFEKVGKAMMESVDILARDAALQGGLVVRGAARASLDAGTAGHRFSDSAIATAGAMVETLKAVPYQDAGSPWYVAIVHPDAYYDLINGGNVLSIAQYQKANILMNQELGMWGKFRLVVSPWAKVFAGAGAANGTAVGTTLSAAANALALQVAVTSATNITVGRTLLIGTAETANTHYPTNERVRVSALYTSGTTVDIIGEGANGGLRFDHANGSTVSNADNVYPVAYGGVGSLIKVFANETGEFGTPVGPKEDGVVNQFRTLGYKFYGGYGRVAENRILRGEYASSLDA